jgi:hypothetical protein
MRLMNKSLTRAPFCQGREILAVAAVLQNLTDFLTLHLPDLRDIRPIARSTPEVSFQRHAFLYGCPPRLVDGSRLTCPKTSPEDGVVGTAGPGTWYNKGIRPFAAPRNVRHAAA